MPRERYEFRVKGRLPIDWRYWFEGMDVRCEPSGDSILSGSLPDQAALHGMLARIRDLNLTLISVTRLPANPDSRPRQEARRPES